MTQCEFDILAPPDGEQEQDNTAECADCGKHIDLERDGYATVDTCDIVCSECIEADYVLDRHGDYIAQNYAVWLTDLEEYEHEDSGEGFHCDDCGNNYCHDATSSYMVDNDDRQVCGGCIEYGDYSYCEDIEQYAHNENCYYDDYSDTCYYYEDNMRRQSGGLHCYSSNVLEVIDYCCFVNGERRGTFGDALLLGVELETDNRGVADIVDELDNRTDIHDFCICKSDATCSGPEIVSLPADLDSHKTVYSWDSWTEVLRPIAKGYHGHDNGMHIHASRAALSATQLGKILVFMNSPDNREFLQVIAQRQINGWCRTNSGKYDSVAKAAAEPADGKYSVVNVMQNTAEFRMFNSTLLAPRIYKNLEFVDAVCEFCKLPSNDHRADYLIPGNFIAYIHRNQARYPYLSEFVAARWR
jgi:hypothetical protein